MGYKVSLRQRKAIERRDKGCKTLADIGHSYAVSVATISRLAKAAGDDKPPVA